ncbi:hypothetical protein COW53_07505 [bacterium CG17_big_fil_post_rev_8_21_14_2_50_64_8]|nr:MAG: hypothetical protein COW53_07505 [bacterium CG17_big_fil_post_rev_8_21_14_2_50_64_8]PJA76228.1 MAG: hypothetical protein CO151_03785 [bacterium CG_4_9_14_3_um_filter_65_15]
MILVRRLLVIFYAACLVTLPLVGVGVLKLTTGRDWGGGLQPAWVLMAAVWGLALALRSVPRGGREGRAGFFSPPRILWFWFGAVLLSGLGLVLARAPVELAEAWWRFGKQIIQLIIMLAFALWAARWTSQRERWVWTSRLIVIAALLQAAYGAVQYGNHAVPAGWFKSLDAVFTSNPAILSGSQDLYVDNAMLEVGRLRGTMCEPLYLGNFLLLALPLVGLTRWRRWLRGLAASVLTLLLILTWSRGAWLAGGCSLVVGGVLHRRVRGKGFGWEGRGARWLWVVLFLMVVVVATLLAQHGPGLLGRRLIQSFSTSDWSNLTRWYSTQAAWRAFLLSPLVGVGWGQFGWHFPVLVAPLGLQSQFTWPVVNNFYLEILCETGVVGLAAFAVFLGTLVRGLLARLGDRELDSEQAAVLVLVGMAFAGVWGQMLTFSQYNLPHIWLTLGLLWAASRAPEPKADGGGMPR